MKNNNFILFLILQKLIGKTVLFIIVRAILGVFTERPLSRKHEFLATNPEIEAPGIGAPGIEAPGKRKEPGTIFRRC